MAIGIKELGEQIEETYEFLLGLVEKSDKFSKEDILKMVKDEAYGLEAVYIDLAKEQGWDYTKNVKRILDSRKPEQ